MKPFVMKPIYCSQTEAALMVKFTTFIDPTFPKKVGESNQALAKMAAGKRVIPDAVLKHLWLDKRDGGYRWYPR